MLSQFSVDVADRLTSHADFLAALKSGFAMVAQHIAALTATPRSVDRDFSGRIVNAEMLILKPGIYSSDRSSEGPEIQSDWRFPVTTIATRTSAGYLT